MATFTGTSRSELIDGTAEDDLILALGGNDTLHGLAGNDTLDGGSGADSMVGGDGNDTYRVDNAGDRVVETRTDPLQIDTVIASIDWTLGAQLERLVLAGAAGLAGTGNALDNLITGNGGANRLDGADGNDTLEGRSGNDTLQGGAGADQLDGGYGADSMAGGAGNDSFLGRLDAGDTIDGGDGIDRLVGLDLSWATDAIHVDHGALLNLYYAQGTKVVSVTSVEQYAGVRTGIGNDVLDLGFVGAGFVTTYHGGAGTDLLKLDFSGSDAAGHTASGVTLATPGNYYAALTVHLSDGTTLATAQLFNDIERLDITGGRGHDILNGGAGDDTLRGGAGVDFLAGGSGADSLDGGIGADRLQGGAGDDLLAGGAGADTLDGGLGRDLAVYLAAPSGVTVDLGAHAGSAGDAQGDQLLGLEGVVGSALADTITGDDADNQLFGAHGADTIHGLGGNDLIDAGSGPVFQGTYQASREMSLFDGGAGNDTIWGATQHISTTDPGYSQPVTIEGGDGDDDIYDGLVVHAGNGDDYVYGGAIDSTIDGGAGNDLIEATYGNHTVTGGDGADLVWTEAIHGGVDSVDLGADDDVGAVLTYDPSFAHRFDGGAGTDRFVFVTDGEFGPSFGTAVNLDLLAPAPDGSEALGTVGIRNFESVTLLLGGDYADTIRLGNFDDWVKAGDGNDLVDGRAGNDYIDGGYGVDTVWGGAGDDVLIAGSSPAGTTEVVRGGGGDDVVMGNFSSADYSGVARLYGDAGHDVFAFLPTGITTADQVMDFDPADDRIALYTGPYFFVDPATRSVEPIVADQVSDTAAVLDFTYSGRFGHTGADDEVEVRYDKHNGELSVRDSSLAGSDWRLVCTVAGAPDLDVAHFVTLPEVPVPGAPPGIPPDTDLWFA